jgi:short-subunit dehydrogenase
MMTRNLGGLGLAALGAGALLAAGALGRRRREMDLRDRTVLITGGSRGLGLVLAREFARRGARVAICARDPEELERARRDLEQRGARVLAVVSDVTDQRSVNELVSTVRSRLGAIDVLVNNAGWIVVGPLEVMTLADYQQALSVHFWAPLYATLAVLPEMRQRRSGRIVNIASLGGKISAPHMLPYCASKFALVGLSAGLRAELARDRVAVTTVCPGLMRTGSPRNATFKGRHQEEYAWFSIIDSLPLISTSAERAARAIVRAARRGDAELVIPLAARVAVRFQALLPGATADLLGAAAALLPEPGGSGEARDGKDSESRLTQSILTVLTQRAARANNELG